MSRSAGLAIAAMTLLMSGLAMAAPLELNCKIGKSSGEAGPAAPAWGDAFTVSVPFGEGAALALIDPESQAVRSMVYGADVLVGVFSVSGDEWPVVWTRATSTRAALLGQVVRSDGHLITVVMGRAPSVGSNRDGRIFDTQSNMAWRLNCLARS